MMDGKVFTWGAAIAGAREVRFGKKPQGLSLLARFLPYYFSTSSKALSLHLIILLREQYSHTP